MKLVKPNTTYTKSNRVAHMQALTQPFTKQKDTSVNLRKPYRSTYPALCKRAPPRNLYTTRVQSRQALIVKCLKTLDGELKGDYYPLAGSNTYEPKPNGIDKDECV